MIAEQIRALTFLGSGAVSLAIAAACFFRAKKAMKGFLRLAMRERSNYEDDIVMMRRFISFLGWGAVTIFLAILAAMRLLDPDQWVRIAGL
jgi:hypothetical protein